MATDDSETYKYLCIWVLNSHKDSKLLGEV
jgi:hypothetical protein